MGNSITTLKASLANYIQSYLNPKRPVSTANLNLHAEMIRHVEAELDAVATEENAIEASKFSSEEGKVGDRAKLANESVIRFGFLEKTLRTQEEIHRDAKRAMYTIEAPPAAGKDELIRFLFAKEIRDRFRNLDQQARNTQFLNCCEWHPEDKDEDRDLAQSHKDATLWAVLATPGGPAITADVLRRALEERGRRLHPDVFMAWQQSGLLLENLGDLRNALVAWLRGRGADQQKVFNVLGGPEPEKLGGPERFPQAS